MRKNKFNNVAGLTLIEIMLGVVISTIMMAAMYTTYNVVNNSYSQVVDRAKISRSGRDIVGMIMRDIRLAGFKYYYGVHKENEDRRENGDPYIPREDYLRFQGLTSSVYESHDPIIIIRDELGYKLPEKSSDTPLPTSVVNAASKHELDYKDFCCDKIHIVYGDFNEDHINTTHNPPNTINQPYKRYRITYYAMPRSNGDDLYYGVYKTKESWIQPVGATDGLWRTDKVDCPECFVGELIRDHLVDMEFIAFNQHGRIINPPPRPGSDSSSRKDLYNIRSVDVRLTFRSKKEFYRFDKLDAEGNIIPRLVKGLGVNQLGENRVSAIDDKYLRDSVVVTIHTRNIGQ